MPFFHEFTPSFIGFMSLFLVLHGVVVLIGFHLSTNLDPSEPPALKPKIPYIGHAVGFLRHQTNYLSILNSKHQLPVYTLPILSKKIYVVTSPGMLQGIFKSKELSFEPFMLEFSQRLLGVSDRVMEPTKRTSKDAKTPSFVKQVIRDIYTSLSGENLVDMNLSTLNGVTSVFNGVHGPLSVDGLYLWLRSILTVATTTSLFGSHNPMSSHPELIDFYWDFENNLTPLLLDFAPSLLAPKAQRGRQAVKSALSKYYTAQYDLEPDVARITKQRASLLRQYAMSDHDIGEFELGLLHGALANTPPILFWLLVHILASESATIEIREELSAVIASAVSLHGRREVLISISKLESHCLLLVSAYRESLRLANSHIGVRRVMADTWISDGDKPYLFKAGADVQIPAGITHLSPETWGLNNMEFEADRFLKRDSKSHGFKEQRNAYHPFGGGKHLCPGRNIAFVPCLGVVAVLLLGFEVTGSDCELLKVPEIRSVKFGEAVAKPFGDGLRMGASIQRKEGWEKVDWKFVS